MIRYKTILCSKRCIVICIIWLSCASIVHNLDAESNGNDNSTSTIKTVRTTLTETTTVPSTIPAKVTNVEPSVTLQLQNEATQVVSEDLSTKEKAKDTIYHVDKETLPTTNLPTSTKLNVPAKEDSEWSGETATPTEVPQNFPQPYEVVYPVRLKRTVEYNGVDTHDYKDRNKETHYDHVTILVTMFGKTLKMKLTLNSELLAGSLKVKQSLDLYNSVIQEKTVESCFYQGTVRKYDDSLVAVSTCHGLSGIIRINNESFVIRPLSPQTDKSAHPHVVYKVKPTQHKSCGVDAGMWEPYQNLHKAEFLRTIKSAKYNQPEDLLAGDTKYVEVALICDHTLYKQLNGSVHDAMMYMLETANIMDAFFSSLKIRLQIVLVEVWNIEDYFVVEDNPRHVLHSLIHHQRSVLKHSAPDVTLMLSGVSFADQRLGLAVPDSICSERAVAVSTNPDPLYPSHAATGLAHMLAHTMGTRHDHHRVSWSYVFEDDQEPCSCADELGCIMDDSPLGHSPVSPQQFSDCSQKDLNGSLVAGLGACLTKKQSPSGAPRSYGQVCGNGVLERGEECDCGSPQACAVSEPCCDGHTCLLKPWATCRHGDCCHNCTVAPPTHMCRGPNSQCDVPEYCTGITGECPSDALFQDGELCGEGGQSYCYQGMCNSFRDQCTALWGKASEPSDFHCYQNFNPSGHFNGHCGVNQTTGQYIKCHLQDVRCGLLHCQGGSEKPQISGEHITFSMTKTVSAGNDYECKIVTAELPSYASAVGLVLDGSPCAIGGVCVHGRCTPITTLAPVTCTLGPNNLPCSGNGVCTTKLECFCHPGFRGLACEERLVRLTTASPPPTEPPTVSLSTARPVIVNTQAQPDTGVVMKKTDGVHSETFLWLMIVLGGVAGSSCVLLLFCMLCYRRRSPQHLLMRGEKKLSKKKILGSRTMIPMDMCKYETASDGGGSLANRAISFGKMPSYRADKIKKALRKSMGEQSETGSEHSVGIRGSTEIKPVLSASLPPPARGILKHQGQSSSSHLGTQTDSNTSSHELLPLRGLMSKGPLPNSPLPWLKAMPAKPLPPTPPDDPEEYMDDDHEENVYSPLRREGDEEEEEERRSECNSQCPSQCSCDSVDKKSLSDFTDDEEEYSDDDKDVSRDAETQTDLDSPKTSAKAGAIPRGMPRDLSSDSLGETKNKILKLKNINDLLRQIDEQFNSVLRQTAAAEDYSPSNSEESPTSETEAERQFLRPDRLSSVLSSPEPLPSPSCIVSPISHVAQQTQDSPLDDSTLPIRGRARNMDPLNILSPSSSLSSHRHRRSSTPKDRSSPVQRVTQPLSVSTDMAVPYRGGSNSNLRSGSGSPGSDTNSHHSPRSLPIKNPHRPSSPRSSTRSPSRQQRHSPTIAQATRLTHPLLDGYPFKRPQQDNSTGATSEGYHSDKPEEPAVIIREIPKKPADLEFAASQRASVADTISSPENVNV